MPSQSQFFRRSLAFEALEPRLPLAASIPLPSLSIADAARSEGNRGTRDAKFVVTLSSPAPRSVTVRYATAPGTAQSRGDFQPRSGSLTFRPGEQTKAILVPVLGDRSIEPDETFTIRLLRPAGATLVKDKGTGIIRNDDFPPPRAEVAPIFADEASGQAIFTIAVAHSGPAPVTINFATVPGTASQADFAGATGTLTFGPDEFAKRVTVPLVRDGQIELDEQFSLVVRLGSATGSLLATGTATIRDADEVPPPATPRVVGYFTSWGTYDRDYQVADIPAERLTNVAYAFAGISAAGTVELVDRWADVERDFPNEPAGAAFHGNFQQLALLKRSHPELGTLLSIGGWDGSARFSDVAASGAARQKFVASVVELLERYGFDGVDLDWEFPVSGGLPTNAYRPADRHNLTLLAQEFRRQFDAHPRAGGQAWLLTAAIGAQTEHLVHYELRDLARFADWLHLMTYDFAGPWSDTTGHNSPLFAAPGESAAAAVEALLTAGVPAGKIVLGGAFYGSGWTGVASDHDGLHQPVGGPVGEQSATPGLLSFREISRDWLPRMTRYWDETAQVPWLYDAALQTFISYDDPQSLGTKARWAREHALGGMFLWELSGDDDEHSLLSAIAAELLPEVVAGP
ncbi:MAG: glycosyl hydrolase family 18 protein [Pirellulaceae bacterium]|nr:glycosyl hydrolase family 18 protein [Pirellulaceae bacterium]